MKIEGIHSKRKYTHLKKKSALIIQWYYCYLTNSVKKNAAHTMFALSHIILNKYTHELHIKTEWIVSSNVKNGMRRTK